MERALPTLLLAAFVVLALPAQGRAAPGGDPARRQARQTRAPYRPAGPARLQRPQRPGGIWVQRGQRLVQISPRRFERQFGVKWLARQALGEGLSEQTLPGYADGFGSFDHNNLDAPPKVAAQYKPSAAERRALRGVTARLYVARVSEAVGHGLFARGTIRKGTVIGEYTGTVRAERPDQDQRNGYSYVYDPWNHFRMLVDARDQGNYLRFANHATRSANAESKLVYDEAHRRWHVLLVATQPIRRGDQILFNYGSGYDWSRFGMNEPQDLRPR